MTPTQDIITLLDVDETVKWCNSFVLVPKFNGKVRLCLGPARLNQALISPVYGVPTFNDILPKLSNAQYLSLIDVTSGNHNQKLAKKSSYLTTFECQFGRYRYKRLPYGATPVRDTFQRKIDEIFKYLLNVLTIADDILIVKYDVDGKDHNNKLLRVPQICRQINLKLNKDKCHFRCT